MNEKEAELQAKLEMKREEAIKAIDEKLEKMKEEMGPAINKLGNLILDGLMKVFEWALTAAGKSPDEIMGIINKARSTITAIVSDPLGFFANLGKAVGQGFQNFTNNIGQHLQNALVGWLTGAVGGAFKIPEKFDVKGVFTMATSVLGIGWDFIRSVLVKIVGEKIMSAAETGFGLITKVVTEGPMALWDEIKDQLSGLKDMVVDAIKNWAIVQIVKKASIKLLSMLNPAGAIVQVILLIYDTVMFFVENWQRIVDFVNSIFSSIGDIAAGKVSSAAKYIEKVLGLGLTMLMSFLARFVGLGGIAKKIIGILNKLRKKVQKAIRKAAKKIGKKIKKWFKGKGGKKAADKDAKKDPKNKKEHDAKVKAGMSYLHSLEKQKDKDNDKKLTKEEAQEVAKKTKSEHKVFKSIKVVDGGKKWKYKWTGSNGTESSDLGQEGDGALRLKEEYIVQPLFNIYPGNPGEFISQIKNQEDGINNMRVEKWIKNRNKYADEGRQKDDLSKLRARIRADIAQAWKRKNKEKLGKQGFDADYIDKAARKYAKKILTKHHAILHNPDQVAGGDPMLSELYKKDAIITDATSLKASKLVGDRGANSSIGSQWGKNDHKRAKNIKVDAEKQLKKLDKDAQKDVKMHVKLKYK